MTRDDLLAASREPNVAAFLRALRLGEGTKDDEGYRRIVGGALADSLADHPRRSVWLQRYGVHSTAAGAYQFLARTWDGLVRQYAFPSFEPQWQDAGAVGLILGRKALKAVRDGDIRHAIALCKDEWASLPGSPYGQRTEKMDAVLLEYRKWGGTLTSGEPPAPLAPAPPAAAAPIEHHDFPPDPPAQPETTSRGESPDYGRPTPMIPILPLVAAVLPSLVQMIPELGKIFGSGSEVSQRNLAGATKVLEAVTAATGSVNALEAVEKIAADPQARQAAASAIQSIWFELVESGGGGIAGARKADLDGQTAGWVWYRSGVFLMGLLLLPLVYAAAAAVLFPAVGGDWPTEVRASALMLILGLATVVSAYWFGASNKPSTPSR